MCNPRSFCTFAIRYSLFATPYWLFAIHHAAAGLRALVSPWRRPAHGGALLFVLILCGALAACCFFFALFVRDMGVSVRVHAGMDVLDSVAQSALQHAMALVHDDIARGPADTYRDGWAHVPRGAPHASRSAWRRYAAALTNLTDQRWFELPGPLAGTRARYRFKITDCAARGIAGPVAWRGGRWLPTDDLNAADTARITELIRTFDDNATNAAWLARAVAQLADSRDDNHALHDPGQPGTEAVRFDRAVVAADQRWVHLDDCLRLGRYYEERASHNFFLIDRAEAFYNRALGRTNIAVTLDREPMTHVAGWEEYRDLRTQAHVPRWHPGMWRGITAATGAGMPEPVGTFKYQRVLSNSTDTLYFDDDNLARYDALGGWRQTVTFAGWFSSLNELTRADIREVRERGALVTAACDAPDAVMMTNFNPRARYTVRMISGAPMPHAREAACSMDGGASFSPLLFNTDGSAVVQDGQPLRLGDAAGIAEFVLRSPRAGVSDRDPFYLESALLQQPEFITLRNDSDTPVSLHGWRLGCQLGTRLFWSAPFQSSIVHHARSNRAISDAVPHIPAHGTLVLTPDAALYDWHYGVARNGAWGDNAREDAPLVALGWHGWGPVLRVREVRAAREHSAPGSSNRRFVWETDWRVRGEDVDALRGVPGLIGVPVVFVHRAEGNVTSLVHGVIVAHDDDALDVRCAGTRARLAGVRDAALHLLTMPRAARDFWLLLPDGQPAARLLADAPANVTGGVRNAAFSGTRTRAGALAAAGISTAHDWFVNAAVYRPFDATACVAAATLEWSPGWARLVNGSRGWWQFDTRTTRLPAGAPGLLYRDAHVSAGVSAPVRAVRDGALALRMSPDAAPLVLRGRTVLLSPSPHAAGLHVFGEAGAIECAWHELPQPSQPVRLTLAGRAARVALPPRTPGEWHLRTNTPITISIDVWDYARGAFAVCADARAFDPSDRLYAGLVPPTAFSNGTLRLRLRTHERLEPRHAALWLEGIYLHPWPADAALNINTAPLRALLPFCGDDPTSVVRVVRAAPTEAGYQAVVDALRAAPDVSDTAPDHAATLSVRADVFDVCVEVEALRVTPQGEEIIARKALRRRIDRSTALADPRAPLRIISAFSRN